MHIIFISTIKDLKKKSFKKQRQEKECENMKSF